MFKKQKTLILLVIIFMLILSSTIYIYAAEDYIDKSKLDSGIIKINYKSNKTVAIRVSKDNINYDYILGSEASIPLQLGNGEYTILILSNVEGNKYKQVHKEKISLELKDSNQLYLQSIQMIDFNDDMEAVKLAKKLTENAATEKEKVKLIYDYIVENISYDTPKAGKMPENYLPNADETLSSKKGVCYDYSALFASMLRSIGIPTKLMMGYKNDIEVYHAWNQIYLSDTDEWVNIDTTYGAAFKDQKTQPAMIREASEYKIEKQY